MRNHFVLTLGVVSLGLAVFAFGQQRVKKPLPVKQVLHYKDVKPILAVCTQCHKGAKPADHLDFSSYASIMKGNKEGKVVIAGNPAKSHLATVLHGKPKLMPPGGPLSKAQIAKIELWIKQGAKS